MPRYRVPKMKVLFFLMIFSQSYYANADVENMLNHIGKTYITSKPLIYLKNLPWYYDSSYHIRMNAPNYLKYNRELREIRNSCSNCLDQKRLITPIRVEYIPPRDRVTYSRNF
jgi:hypothetical protein